MNFNFNKVASLTMVMFFSLLMFLRQASADERKWTVTEPYWTVSKGSAELEEWYNATDSIADPPQNWVEFEYGLSDRDQLAVYEISDQSNLSYGGYQLEYKRRLAEPGEFFLLPTAYLEYHNSTIPAVSSEIEGKLIFEKYAGDVDLAANFVWEKPVAGDDLALRFDRFLFAASVPVGGEWNAGLEYADYAFDHATTVTPDLYTELGHNLRMVAGYEIPLSGPYGSRVRLQMDWEFNR